MVRYIEFMSRMMDQNYFLYASIPLQRPQTSSTTDFEKLLIGFEMFNKDYVQIFLM